MADTDILLHPYDAVDAFHEAFGLLRAQAPQLPDEPARQLRIDLLYEEYCEYLKGEEEDDLVQIADALADMIYIACGTAVAYGIPLDKVFAEVHRSNMAKLVDGKVIRREDGKILKPAGWTPPDIAGIIASAS
jgi:predicted HAD superfamily Cof-like phosphohydrolase